jgi:enediyne biosynthesis protein E4
VLLIGVKSNRSAIGSRVTAQYGTKRQAQEVLAQGSFYSVNDRRLHFGLGEQTSADLTVRWTNGGSETIHQVAANQLVVIREGSGIIRTQKF